MIPGEFFIKDGNIICNEGRKTIKIKVINEGDRPIQVGSHYHFFEVNRQMSFDREKAYGMHLNIISTTAVRFEPGEIKEVELTEYAGSKRIFGHNDLVNGALAEKKQVAMDKLAEDQFKNIIS
ncbi:MAG: urease subunit beta [Candidatus Pedobacter colombiensis]|uniref:Urease subunit beta n=1 Tax=Candidatus Pedobacter colombiensis TaxID=3121371 RepID=A0AAJ5WBS5_9SPHI|nr:urease subunit beta [Pedobacter sp.]WEK21726.1 MAG: urease subunit beta [Pedobacter sp.]